MTIGETASSDDLSVTIQWPRGQDERIAPVKALTPVPVPLGDEGVLIETDGRTAGTDGRNAAQLRLIAVALAELGTQVDVLAAQMGLLVEAQTAQAHRLDDLATGRDVLVAGRDVLADEVRDSVGALAEEIRRLRRRIALRGRSDEEPDAEAVQAVADAILISLEGRIGEKPAVES